MNLVDQFPVGSVVLIIRGHGPSTSHRPCVGKRGVVRAHGSAKKVLVCIQLAGKSHAWFWPEELELDVIATLGGLA